MTAIVLSLPTYAEREALEFQRFGSSDYVRAFDDAAPLLQAAWSMKDCTPLTGRIEAFTGLVERLVRGRPDDAGDFVVLDGGMLIELRAVPPMLAAMLEAGAARRRS